MGDDAEEQRHLEALQDYRGRSNKEDILLDYFLFHKDDIGLQTVESLISLDPGCGELDAKLLEQTMPKCETYFGVQPHIQMAKSLDKSVKVCSNVKVKIVRDEVMDWAGPKQRVDMVLIPHSVLLPLVADGVAIQLIRKYKGWVNTGGKLVVIMAGENRSTRTAGELFGKSRQQYEHSDLLRDLKQLRVKDNQDFVVTDVDLKTKTKALADFYLQCDASDSDVEKLCDFLSEAYPSNTEKVICWINILTV